MSVRSTKVGLLLPQKEREMAGATARGPELLALARQAEAVGLDSVWLADHLLGTAGAESPVFEAWTALAYVAGVTERVRLGHLVNCVSFRNVGLIACDSGFFAAALAGNFVSRCFKPFHIAVDNDDLIMAAGHLCSTGLANAAGSACDNQHSVRHDVFL